MDVRPDNEAEIFSEIYWEIAQAGEPYRLPAPWDRFRCDPAFFRLPRQDAPLFGRLMRKYGEKVLVRAGVAARRLDDVSVKWHPDFDAEDGLIWKICVSPDAKPVTLLANLRCRKSHQWPLQTALREYRHASLLAQSQGYTVVVYCMEEVAMLRSIGIAAVPGGEWEKLNPGELECLLQVTATRPMDSIRYSTETTADSGAKHDHENDSETEIETKPLRPMLVLANWSLAKMDRTDVRGAITSERRLAGLLESLDLENEGCATWKPTQDWLEQLTAYLEHRDAGACRRLLLEQFDTKLLQLCRAEPVEPDPAELYIKAYRAQREAQRSALSSMGGRPIELNEVSEITDRHRVEPLIRLAFSIKDPIRKTLVFHLLSSTLLAQSVMETFADKVYRKRFVRDIEVSDLYTKEDLNIMQALEDQITRIAKEAQRCQPNKNTKKSQPAKSPNQSSWTWPWKKRS